MPRGEALFADPAPARAGGRRSVVAAVWARVGHLAHELGKFGTVGAVAFTVDTLLFYALNARLEPLVAKTLATVVSATVAFLGNRFWTWRHRARSGLGREYGLYFLLNTVGLAIALAVLAASHYGLGALWPAFRTDLADLVAANVVGTALGTLFRFWSYRRFVFLTAETPQVAHPAADPR
ncbi:GtrA family protein [Pilimelia anulata]|uniref:GtrA family protein n=1 Tax=Pilimelia anulata TaxID=53371 RepID=UPI001E56496E|nr:GtrA family protein [Pilimelia anulata]